MKLIIIFLMIFTFLVTACDGRVDQEQKDFDSDLKQNSDHKQTDDPDKTD